MNLLIQVILIFFAIFSLYCLGKYIFYTLDVRTWTKAIESGVNAEKLIEKLELNFDSYSSKYNKAVLYLCDYHNITQVKEFYTQVTLLELLLKKYKKDPYAKAIKKQLETYNLTLKGPYSEVFTQREFRDAQVFVKTSLKLILFVHDDTIAVDDKPKEVNELELIIKSLLANKEELKELKVEPALTEDQLKAVNEQLDFIDSTISDLRIETKQLEFDFKVKSNARYLKSLSNNLKKYR